MKKQLVLTGLLLLCAMMAAGSAPAQNLVGNGSWNTVNFTGWTGFAIDGGTAGAPMIFRTNGFGADAPIDSRCGGVDVGANQSGWRAGMYQTITGLTPGVVYRLTAEGQISTYDVGGGAPSVGNDNLDMFWVDGTDTGFAAAWPGAATTLATLASNTSGWTAMSGVFTPTSNTVVIGFIAEFVDGGWIYASNTALVDNVRLVVDGTDPWDVIYTADKVPDATPTGADPLYVQQTNTLASPTLQTGSGAEQPEGSESYLNFQDNSITEQWNYLRTYTSTHPGQSGTLVMRVRRPVGAVGTGEMDVIDVRNGITRIGLRFIETAPGAWGVKVVDDDALIGSIFPVGNEGDWHTLRMTWAPESTGSRVRIYVNGNPTPSHDNLADRNNTGWRVQTNGNNAGTGEFDLDWWLVSGKGAFAPGMGPVIPAGFSEAPLASVGSRYNVYR